MKNYSKDGKKIAEAFKNRIKKESSNSIYIGCKYIDTISVKIKEKDGQSVDKSINKDLHTNLDDKRIDIITEYEELHLSTEMYSGSIRNDNNTHICNKAFKRLEVKELHRSNINSILNMRSDSNGKVNLKYEILGLYGSFYPQNGDNRLNMTLPNSYFQIEPRTVKCPIEFIDLYSNITNCEKYRENFFYEEDIIGRGGDHNKINIDIKKSFFALLGTLYWYKYTVFGASSIASMQPVPSTSDYFKLCIGIENFHNNSSLFAFKQKIKNTLARANPKFETFYWGSWADISSCDVMVSLLVCNSELSLIKSEDPEFLIYGCLDSSLIGGGDPSRESFYTGVSFNIPKIANKDQILARTYDHINYELTQPMAKAFGVDAKLSDHTSLELDNSNNLESKSIAKNKFKSLQVNADIVQAITDYEFQDNLERCQIKRLKTNQPCEKGSYQKNHSYNPNYMSIGDEKIKNNASQFYTEINSIECFFQAHLVSNNCFQSKSRILSGICFKIHNNIVSHKGRFINFNNDININEGNNVKRVCLQNKNFGFLSKKILLSNDLVKSFQNCQSKIFLLTNLSFFTAPDKNNIQTIRNKNCFFNLSLLDDSELSIHLRSNIPRGSSCSFDKITALRKSDLFNIYKKCVSFPIEQPEVATPDYSSEVLYKRYKDKSSLTFLNLHRNGTILPFSSSYGNEVESNEHVLINFLKISQVEEYPADKTIPNRIERQYYFVDNYTCFWAEPGLVSNEPAESKLLVQSNYNRNIYSYDTCREHYQIYSFINQDRDLLSNKHHDSIPSSAVFFIQLLINFDFKILIENQERKPLHSIPNRGKNAIRNSNMLCRSLQHKEFLSTKISTNRRVHKNCVNKLSPKDTSESKVFIDNKKILNDIPLPLANPLLQKKRHLLMPCGLFYRPTIDKVVIEVSGPNKKIILAGVNRCSINEIKDFSHVYDSYKKCSLKGKNFAYRFFENRNNYREDSQFHTEVLAVNDNERQPNCGNKGPSSFDKTVRKISDNQASGPKYIKDDALPLNFNPNKIKEMNVNPENIPRQTPTKTIADEHVFYMKDTLPEMQAFNEREKTGHKTEITINKILDSHNNSNITFQVKGQVKTKNNNDFKAILDSADSIESKDCSKYQENTGTTEPSKYENKLVTSGSFKCEDNHETTDCSEYQEIPGATEASKYENKPVATGSAISNNNPVIGDYISYNTSMIRSSNNMFGGNFENKTDDIKPRQKSSEIKKTRRRHSNLVLNPFDSYSKLFVDKSPIHGMGIFTPIPITKDTLIMEYKGEIIGKCMSDKREKFYKETNIQSIYMFTASEDKIIDATMTGNLARYINHSCNPNCEAINCMKDKSIKYCTIRDIQPGEELTIDYNMTQDSNSNESCRCGAVNCRSNLKE